MRLISKNNKAFLVHRMGIQLEKWINITGYEMVIYIPQFGDNTYVVNGIEPKSLKHWIYKIKNKKLYIKKPTFFFSNPNKKTYSHRIAIPKNGVVKQKNSYSHEIAIPFRGLIPQTKHGLIDFRI